MLEQAFSFIQKGGFVVYPILICSIITVALAVERFIYFRKAQKNSRLVLSLISEPKKLAQNLQDTTGIFSTLVLSALKLKDANTNNATQKELLEYRSMQAAASLQNNLDIFEFIITLSPLLGLLGTVVGMIQSFSVLNIASGKPLAISAGIGEALIATATGLLVAILAAVCHSFFKNWLNRLVNKIEYIYAYFLEAQSNSTMKTEE